MLENVMRVMELVGEHEDVYVFLENDESNPKGIACTLKRVVWNAEHETYEYEDSGECFYEWGGKITVDMGDRYVWENNRPVWFAFLTYAAECEFDTRKHIESENLPVLIGDTEGELYIAKRENDALRKKKNDLMEQNGGLILEDRKLKKRIERFKRGEITISEL